MAHRRNDLSDGQRILLRKLEVALVMTRDTHDGARAIFHQDIVRYPHWNRFTAERIDREGACIEPLLLFFKGFASRSLLSSDFLREGFDVILQCRAFE